jgi:pimeloyl-ACP methyl ester carboxylesterase
MTDLEKGPALMDRPEILCRLFFPRRETVADSESPRAVNHFIKVEEGISIGCRFYPASIDGPNILCFHGNGEIAPDYDYVAPFYQVRGLNLFVADYRGYGMSSGSPTCSGMINDAHPLYEGFLAFLKGNGYRGGSFVMGRSLGSAPAIEVAYHYQQHLKGLVVESGFAGACNQFRRLGVSHLFRDVENPAGFGNDLKIREVTIPTLIIHGEEDEIIPAGEGQRLYELSGAAARKAVFIPRAGHNNIMMLGLNLYMAAIAEFTGVS